MHEEPRISERAIVEWVGSAEADEGRSYFRDGAILNPLRSGPVITAQCAGRSGGPYEVRATLARGRVAEAECSCPVGDGGRCRHVAALLLTWMNQRRRFQTSQPAENLLLRLDKAELVALMREMLREAPQLQGLLRLPDAAPIPNAGPATGYSLPADFDAEPVRRWVEELISESGGRWGSGARAARRLGALLNRCDDLLEQNDDYAAASIAVGLTEALIESYNDLDDESGFRTVLAAAGECLRRCLTALRQDDPVRGDILAGLFELLRFDLEMGGAKIADAAIHAFMKDLADNERTEIFRRLQLLLKSASVWAAEQIGALMLSLEDEQLSDQEYLDLCRRTRNTALLIDRLLLRGQTEAAVEEARKLPDAALLDALTIFERRTMNDAIAPHVAERASEPNADTRLVEWCKRRCSSQSDAQGELAMAERLFKADPTLTRYREIRRLAAGPGWEHQVRPRLLDWLRNSRQWHTLIDIFIADDQLDHAIDLVRGLPKPSVDGSVQLQLARASEKSRPEEAIAFYREHVRRLIEAGQRNAYREACGHLTQIRALHEKSHDPTGWAAYLDQLRRQYHARHALLDEMTRARL